MSSKSSSEGRYNNNGYQPSDIEQRGYQPVNQSKSTQPPPPPRSDTNASAPTSKK